MNTKIISKGMDLPQNDLDELGDGLQDDVCVPMSSPILKQCAWIPNADDLDPEGYRWIPIDEWMPSGSLHRFKNLILIPIDDEGADEEEWIPFEDLIDIHGDGQEDDGSAFA